MCDCVVQLLQLYSYSLYRTVRGLDFLTLSFTAAVGFKSGNMIIIFYRFVAYKGANRLDRMAN